MDKLVEKYCEMPKSIRRPMWQIWHNLLIRFDKEKEATFMNYGYANLNGEPRIELQNTDEIDRYCIQLYDHVVREADIKGKDVLEVGSGRGGGASYISRYFKPSSYTALDIASSVVKFCNDHHTVENLKFVKGHAEKLPLDSEQYDFVVNVESARCYGNLNAFFSEVSRVLRPGGRFLFADMVKDGEIEDIRKKLKETGFEFEVERNITTNIVKALDEDHGRREKIIDNKVPGFLNKSFQQFAGTKGTERYDSFATGKMQYWSYILKKK